MPITSGDVAVTNTSLNGLILNPMDGSDSCLITNPLPTEIGVVDAGWGAQSNQSASPSGQALSIIPPGTATSVPVSPDRHLYWRVNTRSNANTGSGVPYVWPRSFRYAFGSSGAFNTIPLTPSVTATANLTANNATGDAAFITNGPVTWSGAGFITAGGALAGLPYATHITLNWWASANVTTAEMQLCTIGGIADFPDLTHLRDQTSTFFMQASVGQVTIIAPGCLGAHFHSVLAAGHTIGLQFTVWMAYLPGPQS